MPHLLDAHAQRPAVWITWERHRRTQELSHALSTELCELTSEHTRILRYLVLLLRTTMFLVRRRPSLVVIQCPSVILGVWIALLKPLFHYTFVADLHNEAVVPFNFSGSLYSMVLRLIHRSADLSIVSNARLSPTVERGGGTAFVLPDKLPELHPRSLVTPGSRRNVVFVCTYARDEPYREVIEAAGALGPSVTVFVTGNHNRVQGLRPPENVYLTGFVSERDYVTLLQMADVIVDLTCLDDCLVCGAYEAAALGKPLVTSDTAALREYFSRGTVYTMHDTASLAASMSYALEHSDRLATDMKALRVELARGWARQCDALKQRLQLDRAGTPTKDLIPLAMGR